MGLVSLSFAIPTLAAESSNASARSVQVEPVQAEEGQLPPDFSMAVYEDVLSQLAKSGKFQQVYRSGDKRAKDASNLLVLRMTLLNFEHGNQTEDAITIVKRATKIQVLVRPLPRERKAVFERDVQGTAFRRESGGDKRAGEKISLLNGRRSAPGATKGAGQ